MILNYDIVHRSCTLEKSAILQNVKFKIKTNIFIYFKKIKKLLGSYVNTEVQVML